MEFEKEKANPIKARPIDGLGTRVDLPERIVYLDINNDDKVPEWLPSLYFADWLEATEAQVAKIINKLQIEGRYDEDFEAIVYPPITYQLVKEEYLWRQKYELLDARITPSEMSEILDRDYRYVTKEALSLGYHIRKNKFSKAALSAIRDKELSIPFDEGWYTLRALAVEADKDREWVKNRLDGLGIVPEKRRSLSSGIALNYYPPESLAYIKNCTKEIPEYGEDWYTHNRICEETGKSGHWVSSRLKAYIGTAEMRLDDMRVGRLHYPKYVFQYLLIEAEKTVAASGSGDWLTIKEVAERIGINEKSAKRKLDTLGFVPERRKTNTGKTVYHYNPSEIALMIDEMENFIDESELARKIGKSVYRVCTMLEKIGVSPVKSRYDLRSKSLYPVGVVDILRDRDE